MLCVMLCYFVTNCVIFHVTVTLLLSDEVCQHLVFRDDRCDSWWHAIYIVDLLHAVSFATRRSGGSAAGSGM
jgi:hypothetical protein